MQTHEPVAPATVGGRLLALRKLYGDEALAQRRLSRLARVSPPYVGLIESGEIASPGADKIGKLARVLSRTEAEESATLVWLLRGTGRWPTRKQIVEGVARAEREAERAHA